MEKIKRFFKIESKYKFEWFDLIAVLTILNVVLIMTIGLVASWFGLVVAVVGLVRCLIVERRINTILMQIAMITLNIYFLTLL